MQEHLLRRFNGDKAVKDEVRSFLISLFERQIIERAYKGEDVRAAAEAVKMLEKALDDMDILLAVPEQKHVQTNEAK